MKNIWTDFSISYDKVLSQWDLYLEFVQCALKALKNCDKILDLGCGTGIFSFALADLGKNVWGIDQGPEMLEVLKSKLANYPKLTDRFKQGDALNLPYKDKSFDGMVCNNVIFFVNDPAKLVKEAARVLRPDGILVLSGPRPRYLSDPNCLTILGEAMVQNLKDKGLYENLKKYVDHFVKLSWQLAGDGIYHTYDSDTLGQFLLQHGFTKILEKHDERYLGYTCQVVASK